VCWRLRVPVQSSTYRRAARIPFPRLPLPAASPAPSRLVSSSPSPSPPPATTTPPTTTAAARIAPPEPRPSVGGRGADHFLTRAKSRSRARPSLCAYKPQAAPLHLRRPPTRIPFQFATSARRQLLSRLVHLLRSPLQRCSLHPPPSYDPACTPHRLPACQRPHPAAPLPPPSRLPCCPPARRRYHLAAPTHHLLLHHHHPHHRTTPQTLAAPRLSAAHASRSLPDAPPPSNEPEPAIGLLLLENGRNHP
jgi:hypothetical protein